MYFLKLSPLQSRFAASLVASLILLLLYISLTRPHFAYAFEIDSRIPPDHNHPIILDEPFEDDSPNPDDDETTNAVLDARAASTINSLQNNSPQNMNINTGVTQYWEFTKDVITGPGGQAGKGLPGEEKRDLDGSEAEHELKKRQSLATVYVSINTCLQPTSNTTSSNNTTPPQLLLYYSQSDDNQTPGPATSGSQQVTVDGGYGLINITTDQTVYVGIAAPNTSDFTGLWNYEIGASIDAPFHQYEPTTPYLHFVDADTHAALLITDDLTNAPSNSTVYQEWMSVPPPFGMFGHNQQDASILGVQNSYCGLRSNARIVANLENVNNQNVAEMTNRGLRAEPKEQFYITSLNASSTFWGFLAMQGNSTASGLNVVGGGGKVWAAMNFTTKSETNCALMYNLTFCSEVAYAVPTNPDLFSPRTGLPQLAAIYDSYAARMYQYFNYSLQQIPCNTSASSQYSLARNCDDCARAYKQWLCAVTIPRCDDFTNNATYLKPRNVGQPWANGTSIDPQMNNNQMLLTSVASNQSRNPIIDENIRPGPYKEVLPCDDLCYDLVQSCPAALGFGCPLPGAGLNDSYGFRSSDGSEITCSYLGAAYYLSAASRSMHVATVHSVTGWVLAIILFLCL